MKKISKLSLHAAFWLLIPLSEFVSIWAAKFGAFRFGENQISLRSVFFESFQFLLEPPDKGADLFSGSNLFGIIFNFYLYFLIPVGLFYASYFLYRPNFQKHLKYNIGKALLMLLAPLAITTIFRFLTIRVAFEYPYYIVITYMYAIPFAFLGFIFKMIENRISNEKRIKQNLKSELALLKNQISPHFLFNTLNNIDSLILSNTAKASEMLIKLSEILRYMVYDTGNVKVMLSKEIEQIKNYIELQKIQFANKDLVYISVVGIKENISIAPMLFLPFVENAFKHCTDKTAYNAIKFNFTIHDNHVLFESSNVFDPAENINKDNTKGIGLNILKRRLELIYPEKHALALKTENNKFVANLLINTNDA